VTLAATAHDNVDSLAARSLRIPDCPARSAAPNRSLPIAFAATTPRPVITMRRCFIGTGSRPEKGAQDRSTGVARSVDAPWSRPRILSSKYLHQGTCIKRIGPSWFRQRWQSPVDSPRATFCTPVAVITRLIKPLRRRRSAMQGRRANTFTFAAVECQPGPEEPFGVGSLTPCTQLIGCAGRLFRQLL
jgi:hypothetical protein